MSFLTPLYLLGAALIAVPIVLHLLRRDVAPPVPFTAVTLLRKTPVDRSRRHRLRDLLLLAARICALLLLAASFARPYKAGAAAIGRTTVIAVDRSFSMSAPGRAERARALAREAIDRAGSGRVAVVAFDDRAEVLAPPGAAADARTALSRIVPGFGATRYAAALDKAAELLADDPGGRVILVSDLQRSGFDAAGVALPEGIALEIRDAGAPVSNLSVSSATLDRTRHLASATVRSFGPDPRTVDVTATIGDRASASKRIAMAAGESADVTFDAPGEPASLRVSVQDAGGYSADNARFAVAEVRGLPRVLVVTDPAAGSAGFYLTRALQADAGEGPDFDVRTTSGTAFAALPAERLREQSAIMILSTRGLDRRVGDPLRGFLAAGGGLFVAAAPDVDASLLSTMLRWQPAVAPRDVRRPRVLAATDLRHPVFRPFDALAANFGQILFERAWDLNADPAWRVAARFTDGTPALIERTADSATTGGMAGRVVLFASDVDRRWNDFPLHPTFVPFAQEMARYLGARPAAVSSYLVADVPAGVAPVPGVTRDASRTVAVNVDPRESSVERLTPAEFQKLVTRSTAAGLSQGQRLARDSEAQQNYWRYGLMLLMATLIAEAFVGSR